MCNNSRDIEFFLGDYFFLARPVHEVLTLKFSSLGQLLAVSYWLKTYYIKVISTIALYYNLAGKLILIVPFHRG